LAKICLISKYPPIEGFVSSYAYWLARGLGRRGIEVHVITNAEEVDDNYKAKIDKQDDERAPRNVTLHDTCFTPEQGHIPPSDLYVEKMASLGIEAVKDNNLDLIDSRYLVPYGVSAFLCKIATNKPLVVRHAGSDLERLLHSEYLNALCVEVLRRADKVVSTPVFVALLNSLGVTNDKIAVLQETVDPTVFSPRARPFELSRYVPGKLHENVPVVTYVGKTFRNKGLFQLIKALHGLRKMKFTLLILSQAGQAGTLKRLIREARLEERTIVLGFVPPWKMPSIYKISTCVVTAEFGSPIHHVPIVPREAIAVQRCVVLSKDVHRLGVYPLLADEISMLEVDPTRLGDFTRKIKKVITDPDYAEGLGKNAWQRFRKIEDFEGYITENINLYESLLRQ